MDKITSRIYVNHIWVDFLSEYFFVFIVVLYFLYVYFWTMCILLDLH